MKGGDRGHRQEEGAKFSWREELGNVVYGKQEEKTIPSMWVPACFKVQQMNAAWEICSCPGVVRQGVAVE